MDLYLVIIMNLSTAVILYALFSRRFNAAVERAKRESRMTVIRELRENIENTIRYMDDSLEIIDKKINTFYSLLRRSEEVAAQLEGLSRGPAKKNKNAKRGAQDDRSAASAGTEKTPRITRSPEPESVIEAEPEGPEAGGDTAHLLNLLKKYDDDRVEISGLGETAEALYRKGELTRGAKTETGFGPPGGEPPRVLEKIGGVIGKFFGIERFDSGAPESKKSEQKTDVGTERVPPPVHQGRNEFRVHMNREIQKREERQPEIVRDILRQDRVEVSEHRVKSLEEHISEFETGGDEKDTNRFIRMLVRSGFDINEISRKLDVSPARIELIASLPDTGYRPRKNRIDAAASESYEQK